MPNPPNKGINLDPAYFWSFTKPDGECLIWTGHKNSSGYGHIRVLGKMKLAHRHAWELANNLMIPVGKLVLHSCDVRACVNPDHLRIGGHIENTADAIARGRYVPLRGDLNGNTVRTEDDIRMIRKLRASGETYRAIANRYQTSPENIFAIVSKRTWRHVQ